MGDYKHFDHAILWLMEYPSDWLDSYQNRCRSKGKKELTTWTDCVPRWNKRFVPRTYKQELFIMKAYFLEFQRLWLACDCKDDNELIFAKFLIGLKKKIADFVELHPYETFDDLCLLAKKCNTPIILSFPKLLFKYKTRESSKYYLPCDNVSAYSEFCSGKHITNFRIEI